MRHAGKVNPEAKYIGFSSMLFGIFLPYFFERSTFFEVEELL
jgi:hypothetical protein